MNEKTAEDVRVHLQIIQSTISRMGMNSLYCKIVCVTLVASFSNISNITKTICICSIFMILICAIIDAIYLSCERVYRNKYDNYINSYSSHPPQVIYNIFDMNPGTEYYKPKNIGKAMKS